LNNELDYYRSASGARSPWKSPSDASDPAIVPTRERFVSPSLPALDVHMLRRVSRTMANEVPPARRLAKLLEAAIESTKATSGLIAVTREGGWEEAVGIGAKRIPLDRLPVSILTAAVSLRDGITLHDACSTDRWRTDDYVHRCKPRSVLCVPIRCNGALLGALYLEHAQTAGVFAPTKTAMAEIIALQAGFALENARLQDELSAQHARVSSTEARMRDSISELDGASRLKAYGELAASIVHEVAQPVAALDTSARAGLRWLDRNAPNIDAARETLAHICACAMRARTIISALRAKARQTAPTFIVFDLADALREAAEIVGCTLDAMKVSLCVDGLSSPLPVRGERVQLQQAIINLLMNGAESMQGIPENERVLVLACEPAQNLLRIRVDDSGEGFDPQLAARIFEPLFTTKPHGMGMGLSICKSIVDAHHGQLELTPRLERGTRATVTLPCLSN
jgi:C4-dicarboxylate-specific signal transduction histidine kinase